MASPSAAQAGQHSDGNRSNASAQENAFAGDAQQAAVQQAEELVDRAVERLSSYASSLRRCLKTATARTREEAEDIWAEAQQLRRGN